jgi:hypothetical protein
MNDLSNLMVFLACSGVEYQTWAAPEFIDEEAVKLGAIFSISIRGVAHMNFDVKGNLVGSSTDAAKSHRRKNETK